MQKQITIDTIEIVNEGGTNFQKFNMKDSEGGEYVAYRAIEPKQWILSHAEAFSAIAKGITDEEFRDGLEFIAQTSKDLSDKF